METLIGWVLVAVAGAIVWNWFIKPRYKAAKKDLNKKIDRLQGQDDSDNPPGMAQ